LEHLLFATYLVLFAWLVTKTTFFANSGLSKAQLVMLFLIKVLMGIFYGWMGIYYDGYARMLDTWLHHQNGLEQYELLTSDPLAYLKSFTHDPYENTEGVGKFFASHNSYWNDLKSVMFSKILSIFNLFSFGEYYVNVIFYSFCSFFAPVALYRVANDLFPTKRTTNLIACFLVPSFVYWSSGIHKEGLLALGIALIVYHVYFGLKTNSWPIKRWLAFALAILLLFTLRNFILVVLFPAVLVWVLASRLKKHRLLFFGGAYTLFIILFFGLRLINSSLDFPAVVVEKQKAFINSPGNTSIEITAMEATFSDFVRTAPQAISFTAIRPFPSDANHILSLAAVVEIMTIWLLIILFILFPDIKYQDKSYLLFVLFFSITFLLAIGYSVNNLGAIVRYRSLIFPLFMAPILSGIDWQRIKAKLNF